MTDKFCKSNIKELRSNKEEEADASGPLGLASLSGTSSPVPLPTANDCQAIRLEIEKSRPILETDAISYMRLSMLAPKATDNDGEIFTRLAVNADLSVNNEHKFDKFKWRLTTKRSEFYANLPADWAEDPAYSAAWSRFNLLEGPKWIGKACYRLERRSHQQRLKLVPLTAMVAWVDSGVINYTIWFENAEISGRFDIETTSKFYTFSSEPVKNFKPAGFQMFKV